MRAHTDSGVVALPEPGHPRAASRPATDLGAIARGEPRIEELLGLLEGVSQPARRVDILQEIARVYVEDLADRDAASVALRAALQEDHDPCVVVGALADLAEAGGRWAELLVELMEDAGALGHEQPRRAADLWVQIARWYDDPVGYREYATRAVREALELVPHHAEALATLASFLRDDGYWVELAGVIQRQIAVATDDAERIELYLSLAEVAESQLGEPITAIGACRSALDLDADCTAAIDLLRSLVHRPEAAGEVAGLLAERAPAIRDPEARVALLIEVAQLYGGPLDDATRAEELWEAIDDRDRAIARLKTLVGSGVTGTEAAALHYRLGRFLLRGDADPGRAEWHLSQALADDPGHAASARMLAELYRDRGDWLKASRMLDRASEHAVPDERTELVIANARILADQLGDLEAAVSVCERARDAGATDSAIGRMLVALYARLGRWSELQPMVADLEREVVGRRARTETGALYHIIARAASELGDDDRAFAYYHEARAADRDDPDVIRGLADQYYARSRWREAADEYMALLEAAPAEGDRGAIQYRLGVCLRELGDGQGALAAFTRVLEREPDHLPAAMAVAELLVRARRWGDAARAKAALLELAPAGDRPRLQVELGDLHRDHLDQPRRALGCYSAAVEAEPTNHAALQRRLDAATALGDWATVIDSIERFAAAESVALRRGSYLHAAAVIQRDELDDHAAAAASFEAALDAFFAAECPAGDDLRRCMKSFAALDELHTRRRAFTEQARAYRRMIKRLPPGHAMLPDLWHALGEVYRSRLKRLEEAAAAFEVARSLSPDNDQRREILAELYTLGGGAPGSAAAEHHAILAHDPGRVDSYRALVEIYKRARNLDQAWAACRALVFLEKATPEETTLYQRYASTTLSAVKAPITPELRGRILEPGATGTVATALAAARAAVAAARPSQLALRDDQRIAEPKRDPRNHIRLLRYVAIALERPRPDIYDQPHKLGPLAFGLAPQGGILRPVITPRAAYLSLELTAAAFAAGQAISLLEPERVLSVLFDDDELRSIVAWIAGHKNSGSMSRLLTGAVAPGLRLDEREQLQSARNALSRCDWQSELGRWLRSAVITSDRVGFLLSGDLTASARMIAASRATRGGMTPSARILELLRYSVTDDHATVRRHLCGRI